MRTSAQKTKATQQTTSAKSTKPGWAHFEQSREVSSILHLQRTIGNRAVQRLLQANIEKLEAGSTTTRIQRDPAITRLVFTLPRKAEERLPEEEVLRRFHRREGYFHHHGSWLVQDNVLTITFRPTIYLNEALTGAEATDAESHEEQHYQDFLALAEGLRADLQEWLREGNLLDSEVEDRWSSFRYDLCQASRAFHQRIGARVEICQRL